MIIILYLPPDDEDSIYYKNVTSQNDNIDDAIKAATEMREFYLPTELKDYLEFCMRHGHDYNQAFSFLRGQTVHFYSVTEQVPNIYTLMEEYNKLRLHAKILRGDE